MGVKQRTSVVSFRWHRWWWVEGDEVENYSNWVQTENGNGELHRNKFGVVQAQNNNVGQTDKLCGRHLWTSDKERHL